MVVTELVAGRELWALREGKMDDGQASWDVHGESMKNGAQIQRSQAFHFLRAELDLYLGLTRVKSNTSKLGRLK